MCASLCIVFVYPDTVMTTCLLMFCELSECSSSFSFEKKYRRM